MASVNKVILVGNCGRDPEVRYLPSGQAVGNISIATSSRRKNKNTGEVVEDTQWHRVVFYDKLAEIVGQYVKKGRPVYVEGRLKYGQYQDKESGATRNTCDIVATEIQLLGSRENGSDEEGAASQRPASSNPQAQAPRQPTPQQPPAAHGFDDMDDDIPF